MLNPSSTLPSQPEANMKVLIVEDQRKLALLLKQGLSEAGYGASIAPTCAAARDALCETSFDAIVLDLGLPDGDGLELLRQWRRSGFNEPVIILSARDGCARCCAGKRASRTQCSNTAVCAWIW